jgi:hypothetical protein
MTNFDDRGRMILRNMLLGRWAAEKLGIAGREADAYSDALARSALDSEGRDVFAKLRKDFDDAGVAQSDEQILHVMTEFMIKAGNQMVGKRGGSLDAAEVMLKRNLMSR